MSASPSYAPLVRRVSKGVLLERLEFSPAGKITEALVCR
jgi:hypothetical protein